MLRNNKKNSKTIVSRLFDTINKMSDDTCEADTSCEAETDPCEALLPTTPLAIRTNYILSVPNERKPLKFANLKPFVICLYQVCLDGLYPFILFLLHNANFIALPTVGSHKKIKYDAIAYIKSIFPDANLSYEGFSETDDKNSIVLNYSGPSIVSTEYQWATSFEILNKRKVLNSIIDKSVLDFFYLNPSFLTLKTLDQHIYESPMVGYVQSHRMDEVDIYREVLIPGLGKCYYVFTELPPDQADKHIMRIVFFAGKMILPHERENTYDSMLCYHKQCYYYIIQNYNQHVVLSVE